MPPIESDAVGWVERIGLPAALLVLFVVLTWKGARPLLDKLVQGHLAFLDSVVKAMRDLGDTLGEVSEAQKGVLKTQEKMAESQERMRVVLQMMESRLERIESRDRSLP